MTLQGFPVRPNLLEDVSTLLAPTFGEENIWQGWMPEKPNRVIAFYEDPGMPPSRTQDGTYILRPQLLALVRGEPGEIDWPRQTIQKIHDYLGSVTNQPVGGSFYLSFIPTHAPEIGGRDTLTRPHYQVTFSVMSRRLDPNAILTL